MKLGSSCSNEGELLPNSNLGPAFWGGLHRKTDWSCHGVLIWAHIKLAEGHRHWIIPSESSLASTMPQQVWCFKYWYLPGLLRLMEMQKTTSSANFCRKVMTSDMWRHMLSYGAILSVIYERDCQSRESSDNSFTKAVTKAKGADDNAPRVILLLHRRLNNLLQQ